MTRMVATEAGAEGGKGRETGRGRTGCSLCIYQRSESRGMSGVLWGGHLFSPAKP